MSIDWDGYEKLSDLAKRLGIPYSTIHTWITDDKLPGTIKRNGTQWMIPLKIVEVIESGDLDMFFEKDIEARLIRVLSVELEATVLKTHVRNWPDRACFMPEGHCFFVETKRPGEDMRPSQKAAAKQLRKLGFTVYQAAQDTDIRRIILSEKRKQSERNELQSS